MVEVAAYVLRNLSLAESQALTPSLVPVLGRVSLDQKGRFGIPKWQESYSRELNHVLARTDSRVAAN
jgi:hypothetical protein